MLVKTAATSYVGLHRFCRMSKHSSPVAYTFGWNIWLMNFTAGGLLGYCSSKCITSLKVPSSKGVSAGPMMTAFLDRGSESQLLPLSFGVEKTGLRARYSPGHDIIGDWRCRYAGWGVSLHALEEEEEFS